jgi:5-methylcytosine-specific restriction endonuclease McrA
MAKPWAKAFYKSKPWRSVRDEVRRRDQYTCHDCGARAEEVHHIIELTPENIHDPNIALNPDNLMSLCGDCHKKRTKNVADVVDGYCFDEQGNVVPE